MASRSDNPQPPDGAEPDLTAAPDDVREARFRRLPASTPAAESTVGTGSIFAIGCAILALMVIFAGIAFFFLA